MSAHRQYVPVVAAAFRFVHAQPAAGGFIINDAAAPDKPHKVECFGRRVKGDRPPLCILGIGLRGSFEQAVVLQPSTSFSRPSFRLVR